MPVLHEVQQLQQPAPKCGGAGLSFATEQKEQALNTVHHHGLSIPIGYSPVTKGPRSNTTPSWSLGTSPSGPRPLSGSSSSPRAQKEWEWPRRWARRHCPDRHRNSPLPSPLSTWLTYSLTSLSVRNPSGSGRVTGCPGSVLLSAVVPTSRRPPGQKSVCWKTCRPR